MYDSVIVSLAYPDIDTYFNCNNANAGRSIYNPFYKGRINLGRGTDIALKLSVGCAAKDITLTFAPVSDPEKTYVRRFRLRCWVNN